MSQPPLIALEEVRFAYPDGTMALDGVTLTIDRGERVAVVGANGAGKSTLLLHLNGLLRGQGTVRIGGRAIADATLPAIRRQVGFIFQDPDDQLFCPSVADDVAFGPRQQRLPPDQVQTRVAAALAAVGIADLAARHPHHLSLGQKRRAAIASVLACEPDILALDEPTSNLDPRGRREFLGLLRGLGCTLVLATHDLAAVQALCTRVVIIRHGRILADGTPHDLLTRDELLDEAHLR